MYRMWQLVSKKEADWVQDVATALEVMAAWPPYSVIRTGIKNEQVIAALRKTGVPIEEDNHLGNQFWFGFEDKKDSVERSDRSDDSKRKPRNSIPAAKPAERVGPGGRVAEDMAVRTRRQRKTERR